MIIPSGLHWFASRSGYGDETNADTQDQPKKRGCDTSNFFIK